MKKAVLCFIFILLLIRPGHPAFQEIEQAGARVIGLGYAFTGLADDINAMLINPAGIMNLSSFTFSLSSAALYPGLDNANNFKGNIQAVYPLKSLPSFLSRMNLGAGFGFLYTEYYKENLVHLSAAYRINERVSTGLNLKLLAWSGQVVSLFKETKGDYSATALSLDLGLQYTISDFLKFGMSFQDVNQPDISSSSSPSREKMPVDYRFGLGFKSSKMAFDVDLGYCEDLLTE
ncbi:MAG: hypothetical protein PHF84_06155, partial [bacterium]|nr:hypothetical protein [bacterium]